MVVAGGVVGQAGAELLEVEAAAGLAHLVAGLDARRAASVSRPAMKMPAATATSAQRKGTRTGTKSRIGRRPSVSATNGDGPPGEAGGRLDSSSPSSSSRSSARPEPVDPVGQGGVVGELALGELERWAFELAEGVIEHVVGRSWDQPFPSRGTTFAICWSLARAACSRDLTVPTGIFRISAISRYFRSWW